MPVSPMVAAERLRRRFQITAAPVNPGLILPYLADRLRIEVEDWPAELSGVFVRGQVQSVIGLNKNHPRERQHFTLWHEFYHWAAHRAYRVCFEGRTASARAIEREADAFAVELLMPEGWVVDLWDRCDGNVRAMARRCAVSPTAMRRRVVELGLGS